MWWSWSGNALRRIACKRWPHLHVTQPIEARVCDAYTKRRQVDGALCAGRQLSLARETLHCTVLAGCHFLCGALYKLAPRLIAPVVEPSNSIIYCIPAPTRTVNLCPASLPTQHSIDLNPWPRCMHSGACSCVIQVVVAIRTPRLGCSFQGVSPHWHVPGVYSAHYITYQCITCTEIALYLSLIHISEPTRPY